LKKDICGERNCDFVMENRRKDYMEMEKR